MNSPFKLPLKVSEFSDETRTVVEDGDAMFTFASVGGAHTDKIKSVVTAVNAQPAVVAFLEFNIENAVFLQRADARRVFVKQAESLLKQIGGE